MVSFKCSAGDYLALNWADSTVKNILGTSELPAGGNISCNELSGIVNSLNWADNAVNEALTPPKDKFTLSGAKNDIKSNFAQMTLLQKILTGTLALGGIWALWKTGALAHDFGKIKNIFSKKPSPVVTEKNKGFFKQKFEGFKNWCSDSWQKIKDKFKKKK